ncbi:DUF1254 domain-containing protein [Nocardia flavorosea]|uniref:DUF1254 domain-containing protein n=1 Tax=Nocardia flavorosea TaxID=53429 RepID=A0A846YIC2_9NOCA|nr:DUF1254 domain-containing protein [Nocardia flavorosea]NKY57420.1 DUF1254 domain-containing protein [Nocardia flavorosea]
MSILSDDLRTLSYEATLYFYPLVTMDISRRQQTGSPAGVRPGFGPPNEFHHMREFPPADFRAVVRPNFDTLYSIAWLDLTAGPVVVHTPDTGDRYYMLPMLDMWTDVFASPGKRTTGTGAGDFVVTAPGYRGPLPEGAGVIPAPTPHVWIIGRTQTNGPADYAAVNAIQDGYRVTPLGDAVPPAPAEDATTEPLTLVHEMSALDYFAYAADLLVTNPPHLTDQPVLARLERLGIIAGQPFDTGRFTAEQRAEIDAGRAEAFQAMHTAMTTLGSKANGWAVNTDTMGVYGNFYLKRAMVTMVGLGANPPEDAVYPLLITDSDGDPVTGEHDYVLHFGKDELPPVAAFWSVTMYDDQGFQVANELGRFAIGDRDPLSYNADGSLDLYLQHTHPGPAREPNWLPAPPGPLGVTMRLYAPLREALDGRWQPPPLRKA